MKCKGSGRLGNPFRSCGRTVCIHMPEKAAQEREQGIQDKVAEFRPIVSEEKRATAALSRRGKHHDRYHDGEGAKEECGDKEPNVPRTRDEEQRTQQGFDGDDTSSQKGRDRCRNQRIVLQGEDEQRPMHDLVDGADSQKSANGEGTERCRVIQPSLRKRLTGATWSAVVDFRGVVWRSGQWRTVRLTVRPRPSAFPAMLFGTCSTDPRSPHANHEATRRTGTSRRTAVAQIRSTGPEAAPVSSLLLQGMEIRFIGILVMHWETIHQ